MEVGLGDRIYIYSNLLEKKLVNSEKVSKPTE